LDGLSRCRMSGCTLGHISSDYSHAKKERARNQTGRAVSVLRLYLFRLHSGRPASKGFKEVSAQNIGRHSECVDGRRDALLIGVCSGMSDRCFFAFLSPPSPLLHRPFSASASTERCAVIIRHLPSSHSSLLYSRKAKEMKTERFMADDS